MSVINDFLENEKTLNNLLSKCYKAIKSNSKKQLNEFFNDKEVVRELSKLTDLDIEIMICKLINILPNDKKTIEAIFNYSGKNIVDKFDYREYQLKGIEKLLDIKVEEKNIIECIDNIFEKTKPASILNDNDVIDIKNLQGYLRNQIVPTGASAFSFGAELIVAINFVIFQEIFKKCSFKNRHRDLKREIEKAKKRIITDEDKIIFENIKEVLLSIKSQVTLNSIIQSLNNDNIKIPYENTNKTYSKKTNIKLFDVNHFTFK